MPASEMVTPELLEILEDDIAAKGSVSEALLRKIAAAVNYAGLYSGASLGDIKTTFLPTADFQAINSTAWVPIDGSDITNTDYGQLLISRGLASGTVLLPDARGMELVGVNDGRNDGHENSIDLASGQFQDQRLLAHSHKLFGTTYQSSLPRDIESNPNKAPYSNQAGSDIVVSTTPATVGQSSTEGSTQTNSKRIAVHRYIKVWNVAPDL